VMLVRASLRSFCVIAKFGPMAVKLLWFKLNLVSAMIVLLGSKYCELLLRKMDNFCRYL
jgi:hypothetical protein